jgi:ubiquinone/menaquinone biosynthesis C-methylase UbiE
MSARISGMGKYVNSCKSEFWEKIFQAETEYILENLNDSQDILSVGCGPAVIEKSLAKHGFNITGLDISQEALNQAPDDIRKIAGSAEKMFVTDCSFDTVIYVASLQFIVDYKKAIEETVRVLKSGGKLLVMLLNPESEFFKEKTKNPDSYVNKIKHTDLREIEKVIAKHFSVQTEYLLGIKGQDVFETTSPSLASLYVIKGYKKI